MLSPIKSTYKEYVIEQLALSSNQEMIDYWRAELSDYRKYEFPEQPRLSKVIESNTSIKTLSSERYNDLQRAAQQQRVTVKSICLAAYISTLYMFSYESDILIGLVENGRPVSQDGARMLGCFLNTVPLRTIFQPGMSWGDIVQYVQVKQNELKKYGRLSLVQIQKAVEEQSSMENPFFDTAFNFIDFHVYETVNEGLFEFMPFSFERTNTLLDFSVSVTLGELSVKMVSMYDKQFTDRLFDVYLGVMDCMMNDTHHSLDTASILTMEEREKLQRYNDTTAAYPRNESIVSLFKKQVSTVPDHPALIMGDAQLTYKELDQRVETAAAALLNKGVRPGATIGMLAERSMDMIISIFAILRAGSTYIPLDPAYPDERVREILTDSMASWLITDQDRVIQGYHGKILSIRDDLYNVNEMTEVPIPAASISPEGTAYIMYTSGSTGKPKGVVTTHRNIVKTSVNNGFMDVLASDRILQLSNYAFDGSTYEIFGALLNGASLVLISKQQLLNVQELANTMLTQKITSCFMTAALFNTLVDWDVHSLRYVRRLFFGGEAASKTHVTKALEVLGANKLVNGYGPTETTVFASTYSVDERLLTYDTVPIGKPIHNTRVYVLNRMGQLQPLGVPGELCVTGDGLASGYLNRQDLSDERFVSCPFEPGQRMYRTGDLVRWLPDGMLEYRGRIDQQVKIRGNRVELTEIQGKLVEIASIKEAVVTAQRDPHGHSYLCAYVVPEGTENRVQEWKKELRHTLPEYMIPSTFITISMLPKTSNGKLDHKALPAPEQLEHDNYSAPTNELEERLISLWEETLQLKRIGIDEHFFEIGGHSLKAMMLAAKIQKSFGVHISLQDVFKLPTIREMAEWMVNKQKSHLLKIQPAAPREFYPASSIQKRLYIVQQFENANTSYNMPITVDLKGRISVEKLEQNILELIQRHEVLRTSFEIQNGELCQKIHRTQDLVPFILEQEMLRDDESSEEAVKRFASQFIAAFDLGQAPLFRAGLVKLADDHHILMLDMHHIISDGMSIQILLKDLIALYEEKELPEIRIHYKDFAVWESELDERRYESSERYWLSKFKQHPAVIDIPTDYVRPVQRSFDGERVHMKIPNGLVSRLRNVSAARHDTLFMIMMAAYQVLLAKYSGQDDIVVGTPFSLRGEVGEESLTGMFANTLAIRTTPDSGLLVREYLDSVHKHILSAFEHGMYPLQKLINRLSLSTDHRRHPLFETMFVVQEQEQEPLANTGLTVDYSEWDQGTSKFDMTWICSASEEGMELGIEYRTDLWTPETIQRIAHHYFHILNQLLEYPNLRIGDVELLTSTEAEQLDEWNNTDADYPAHLSIAELFEQQSKVRGEADALIMGRNTMSYRALNEAANQLAWYLFQEGLQSGQRVGLLMDRSMDMIVIILAVVKAGGVYVPLDPTFPEDRILFMLEDSQADLVIASDGYELSGYEGEFIHYNTSLWSSAPNSDLGQYRQIEPTQPLYIMYTSGSTGTPKGVVATHRNIVKTMINNGYLLINHSDRFLQASNYAFDGATFDIFGALLHGASLVLIERTEMLNAAAMVDVISSQQITVLFLTTALFNTLIDFDSGCFLGTRKVLFGGEKVSVNHVGKALDVLGEGRLIHMYGPTEATVFSTFHEISSASHVPIGRPMNNTTIYVLNKSGQRQPIGIPGELYIGGDGIALTYLNRPELTSERFVVIPRLTSSRLYKTGDCVKMLPDGSLEFVERIDLQVKIRGHRIELGEIEAQIRMLEGVQETVVVANSDEQGHSYLGAYIVPEDKRLLTKKLTPHRIASWKNELKPYLPEYMIPTVFVTLEELPLTSNGKVDRRSLPKPELRHGDHYAPATNETQKVLVSLWEEVLGISRIGIYDHFFEIGGHSLKAMMLVGRIHQQFNVKMSLSDIFQMPILEDMSAWIQQSDLQPHMAIESVPEQSEYPLTDLQKQIYYAYQHEEAALSYNMPMLFELKGMLDVDRLEASFVRIIGRHEALRTSIHLESGQFSQRICDTSKLEWRLSRDVLENRSEEVDMQDNLNQWMTGFVKPFQLNIAPLFRVSLLTVHPELHYLALDTHHIISDGASTELIYEELMTLYRGLPLKPVRVQYKDYAVWKNERIKDKAYQESEQFWLAEFSDFEGTAELPMDNQRPAVKSPQGSIYRFDLPDKLCELLRQEAEKYSTTHFTLLLAAYSTLLARYSGEEDIVVGTPIAGRNHADTQQTMGMFVNTLPLRVKPDSAKTVGEYITNLKQDILDAFEHGEYSLSSLTEKLNIPFSPSRNPLFDTLFVLQDMRLNATALPELNIRPMKWRGQQAKFDMTWAWQEEEGQMKAEIEYRSDLWNEASIARMAAHYERLLHEMLIHRNTKLKDLEMQSDAEYDQFEQWNQTQSHYPNDLSLIDLFERRAKEQPGHIALQYQEQEISYRTLNDRVVRMAGYLWRHGIRPGSCVGLLADRNPEMIVSILAILKVGAAYVPLDPSFPDERLHFMLENSAAKWLIAEEGRTISQYAGTVISLSEPEIYAENSFISTRTYATGADTAYVMYTSGSTGQPKGVITTHKNVINVCCNNGFVELGPGDRMLQLSNYAFDGSTFDIFGALLNGATLVLMPSTMLQDVSVLSSTFRSENITVQFMTTALFNTMVDYDMDCLKGLRKIIFGGEAASYQHVLKVLNALGEHKVINAYGPTETTVFASMYSVDHHIKTTKNIPIGRPIRNTRFYVLNAKGKLQPVGIPGELYIAGDGLAEGYLSQPELTSSKFIDGFHEKERMYRTGDIVKWLPNGELTYISRADGQLKIRGNRIESDEVKKAIISLPDVNEAVVAGHRDQNGTSILVAYVVCDSPAQSSEEKLIVEWRQRLRSVLPEYMIPSLFILLDSLPLNHNGKVDWRALPEPEITGSSYVEPTSDTEIELAQLWSELLGIETIGSSDSFFLLGGHSLKAMMLAARISERWAVKIALPELFNAGTLAEMAGLIEKGCIQKYAPIPKAAEQVSYPVSSAQKRLYLIEQFEDTNNSYNMPIVMRMKGTLVIERLELALIKLIHRHEALRTSYAMEEGEVRQRIHPINEIEFKLIRGENVQELSLNAFIESCLGAFIRPFDLSTAPLIRAGLYHSSNEEFLLFIDTHHIASDGITTGILYRDLIRLYEGQQLKALPAQYKDYASWQTHRRLEPDYSASEQFWVGKFEEPPAVIDILTEGRRPMRRRFDGAVYSFEIEPELYEQLKELSIRTQSTMFMILLAGYNLLLSKYTAEKDIVVGTPIAGRYHSDTASIAGMFVNTIALRNRVEGHYQVEEWISLVRSETLQAFEHGEYPLDELVEKLRINRDPGRSPLFDTMFVLQDARPEITHLNELDIEPLEWATRTAKFDMTWAVDDHDDLLKMTVEYSTELYQEEQIDRMAHHFVHILNQMTSQPNRQLQQLQLITAEEEKQILECFNSTAASYPRLQNIIELFEEQVLRRPDHTAVQFDQESLTYSDLNRLTRQFAGVLIKKGLRPGTAVGIRSERSIEMIVGILGILRAGGAYVPIDPSYPDERAAYMLNNSGASILAAPNDTSLDGFHGVYVPLEPFYWSNIEAVEVEKIQIDPEMPAYIMYTSGSTGEPKGVVTTHQNVVKTSINNGFVDLKPEDRILQLSNYAFDGSTFEIFGSLLNGSTLIVIRKEDVLDIAKLAAIIEKEHIASFFITTTLFNALVDYDVTSLKHTKRVFVGGEATSKPHMLSAYEYLGANRIANGYGPTETTVFATTYNVDETLQSKHSVPIGRPIHNTRTYVISEEGHLQPIGIAGELYIAGDGLAQEYLGEPQMTRSRFTSIPSLREQRLYRSGDKVKWLPDGSLEFISRIDHQVKIRGHRVEPGEIEARLLEHPLVKEAVVIARKNDSAHHLCAYLVNSENVSTQEIRRFVQEKLPEYMIPSYFIFLAQLPLTRNGKLDHRALPDPDFTLIQASYIAPQTEEEIVLSEVWTEVLGVDQMGVEDNFFTLGGDSIKSIQIVSKLAKLNWKLQVKHLMLYPTIAECALYLERTETKRASSSLSVGEVPLTPIQAWFFEQNLEHEGHFNQSMVLYNARGWNEQVLHKSLAQLIAEHDALRIRFIKENAVAKQIVCPMEEGPFYTLDTYELDEDTDQTSQIEYLATGIQSQMDITRMLVKIGIFKTNQGDHLLIAMHHLIIDGVSWRILIEDLMQIYNSMLAGEEPVNLGKTDTYYDWSHRLTAQAVRGNYRSEASYWNEIEERASSLSNSKQEPCTYKESATLSMELDVMMTLQLLTEVHRAYHTEVNDLLLSALALTYETETLIHLEGHGREELVEETDLSRTIGWFTSIYPVILSSSQDYGDTLRNTKEMLRGIPNKGAGYGVLKYLTTDMDEGVTASNPDIVFNYLGQFESHENNQPEYFSPMPMGNLISPQNRMTHQEEWNCVISESQFKLTYRYNPIVIGENTAHLRLEQFKSHLQSLIHHCIDREEEYTPSDYTDSDLTFDELDDIEDIIKGL